jgi:hypothetical protein
MTQFLVFEDLLLVGQLGMNTSSALTSTDIDNVL